MTSRAAATQALGRCRTAALFDAALLRPVQECQRLARSSERSSTPDKMPSAMGRADARCIAAEDRRDVWATAAAALLGLRDGS